MKRQYGNLSKKKKKTQSIRKNPTQSFNKAFNTRRIQDNSSNVSTIQNQNNHNYQRKAQEKLFNQK